MKSLKTMRISDLKVGKDTIEFEKQQLGLYTVLVNKYPENKLYQRTQAHLLNLIKVHKNQLKAKPEPLSP